MPKTRTRAEKNAKPFSCGVPKCKQYFATEAELRAHIDSEHGDVPVIDYEDGSWTLDLREYKPKKSEVPIEVATYEDGADSPDTAAEAKAPEPEIQLKPWSKADAEERDTIRKYLRKKLWKVLHKNPDADLKQVIGYAYGPTRLGTGLCRRVAELFGVNIFEETIMRLTKKVG